MDHKSYGIHDFGPQERVIAVVRHHWFIFLIDIVGILLLFFIPFLAVPFLMVFLTQGGVDVPTGFGFFFGALWALFLWHMLFAKWTDYYFDIWIVTSDRIIDVDQRGFFHRDIATLANYEHVEDVQFTLAGVIGNLLNYGDVQVQTAGAHREFIMESVSNPQRLERLIREAIVTNHRGGHGRGGIGS